VRGIPSGNNLLAQVEGDIEDVGGVMRITNIRLHYRFQIPKGTKDKVARALTTYAEGCPAYQSVKGCIRCSWDTEIDEK
jgi:OsmC-like protein